MSKESRRADFKRWMPAIVSCCVLLGAAMWASTTIPQPPSADTDPDVATRTAERTLGEWDGHLALFEEGQSEPVYVYDVVVATLPEEEQQRLRSGIAVESEEMLASLLENYTS